MNCFQFSNILKLFCSILVILIISLCDIFFLNEKLFIWFIQFNIVSLLKVKKGKREEIMKGCKNNIKTITFEINETGLSFFYNLKKIFSFNFYSYDNFFFFWQVDIRNFSDLKNRFFSFLILLIYRKKTPQIP